MTMNFDIVSTIPPTAKWLIGITLGIFAVWFVLGVIFKGPSSEDDRRND